MKQTSGPFECVRYYDPAIAYPENDGGAAALQYALYRDMSTLQFVDPRVGRPMVFTCRRLSRDQRKIVTSASDEADIRRRAFLYGVLHVKDWVNDAGQSVVWEARRKDDGAMMADDCLDDFGEDDVAEIGAVIRGQSFLARGVQLHLLPLPSSQAVYLATRHLSAELIKASSTLTATP